MRTSRVRLRRGRARAEQSAPRRAFLHVGAPKTGTTFLQDFFWANRRAVAEAGLLYPGATSGAHHRAALDLRAAQMGAPDPAAEGAWERLVAEAREGRRDLLISSELLAWATPEQASLAVSSLSSEFQVHVVFTARDLLRQVPAVWQEEVKNRRTKEYAEFLRLLVDPETPEGGPAGIWGGQDPRLVMRAWAASLPPRQVHVVTVPPPHGPPDALLSRFCSVLGLDHSLYDSDVGVANVGLGLAEAEFLRRLNSALPESFPWPSYHAMVKGGLAVDPLAAHRRDGKPPVPRVVGEVLVERTRDITAYLRHQGFDVVGDLGDLEHGCESSVLDIDDIVVDADHMIAAGVDATSALLQQLVVARRKLRQASTKKRARSVRSRLRGRLARRG